uniref:K Homology domain-containing protein n=1 Tax=Ditylenchus dipsaci TaxID=166011 RepID=A0A915CKX5_9BILA
MKRNSGYGDGSGKRQRFNDLGFNEALDQGQYQLRLLIPTRAAGSVIGKGGENINSLSKKYEASMSVPDRNTAERVLTIVCNRDSIVELFKEVIHILLQDQKAKNETRMLVHQSHVGQIMGHYFQRDLSYVNRQSCAHSGPEENIAEAVQILINDLSAIPVKSVERPYDPANYDPGAAYVYGGFSGGGVGSMRRGGGPGGDPRGPRNDYNQAPGHYDGYGGAGGYPDGGYGRTPAVFPEDYLRGADAVQMAIPKELCGKIFGNNGELVNSLMKDCGSRIDVGITISGTPQQIEMTQNMLKQSIRKPEPPAAPAGYYMDKSLMNERVPDETGLVGRKAEAAQFMYDAAPESTDFMSKYKF